MIYMKIVVVSKYFLDIEQYVEFEMSVLISPSKILISLCWVTYVSCNESCLLPNYFYSLQTHMKTYIFAFVSYSFSTQSLGVTSKWM